MGFIPENVIVNLKKEIAASGGAAIEALTTRVQTLENTVGDENSGLVKDVDDLETVVGDENSGLVKDVDDLETVVGDSSSGLVKAVNDLSPTTYIDSGITVTNGTLLDGGYFRIGNIIFLNLRVRCDIEGGITIAGLPATYTSNNSTMGLNCQNTNTRTPVYAEIVSGGNIYITSTVVSNVYMLSCFYIERPAATRNPEDNSEDNDLK